MRKLLIIGASALLGACAQPQQRAAPSYPAPNYQAPQAAHYYDANWRTKWRAQIPAEYANGTCTYQYTATATGHQTFMCPNAVAASRAAAQHRGTTTYTPAYSGYVPMPSYSGGYGYSSSYSDDREELEDRIQELQDRIDDLELQQMMDDDN